MLSMKPVIICFLIYVHSIQKVRCIENYKDYKNFKYFDVKGSKEELEILKNVFPENGDTVIYLDNGISTQIIVAPKLNGYFRKIIYSKKLKATLISEDVSQLLRLEKTPTMRRKGFSWDAYYDVQDIYRYLRNVSTTYPEWTEEIVGGNSYEGREIRGIRILTPTRDGTTKPVFFIESGIHAREWIAPATTTYFINQLLTSSDPNVTRLRDQFDWHIFPTVNPDGYHYSYTVDRMWRKTRSISYNGCIGADPNRNWDYNWGQYGSSSDACDYQTYRGSRPFSEIETRSLSSYISKMENMLFYVAFHSYASILLLPYSDSTEHVDNYDDLKRIGESSLDYGYKVNRIRYKDIGTAAEIIYKASGGSMDWVRKTFNTPLVYTYELRGKSFHWPASKIVEQGKEVTQMMVGLATEADTLGYY